MLNIIYVRLFSIIIIVITILQFKGLFNKWFLFYSPKTINPFAGQVPEGGVQVLPTEMTPSLHPVHQRDTYTFHGGSTSSEGGRIHPNYPNHPSNPQYVGHLPEPPIPVSEIGPIPPPPMFSTPSPSVNARNCPPPPYHPPNSVSSSSIQKSGGHTISMSEYHGESVFFIFYLNYLNY